MENWEEISVSELGRIVTGKTPPTNRSELFGDKYPFITPTDINNEKFVNTSRFLSEEGKEYQKNQLLPGKAVCFTCIGATIGKMCMTNRTSFSNQQINSVIVDSSNYDSQFVFYLLKLNIEKIRAMASGAATPIINKSVFSSFKVQVPTFKTQQKIASILSAYDDLIENNTRRISILEEMAQMIYREWFVNFRFPGHEKVKMVDSPLGKIPEGWEVHVLGDLINIQKGKKAKNILNDPTSGTIPYLLIAGLKSGEYLLYG